MINSIRQEVVTEFANTGFSSKLVSSVMYGSSDTGEMLTTKQLK